MQILLAAWGGQMGPDAAVGIAAGNLQLQPLHPPFPTLIGSGAGKRRCSPAGQAACGPSGCGSLPEVSISKGAAPSTKANQGRGPHRSMVGNLHADGPRGSCHQLAMFGSGMRFLSQQPSSEGVGRDQKVS